MINLIKQKYIGKALLFILVITLIQSCIVTRNMKKKNDSNMVSFSKESIDGLYSNKIEGEKWINFGLWDILYRSSRTKLDSFVDADTSYNVKLELVNENLLNVKLIKDTIVYNEFNLKGKIDKEYFSVKRKYFLLPIPMLLFHFETKNLIGNSINGDLIVMHGTKREGWVLFMAGGGGGISKNRFIKISEK